MARKKPTPVITYTEILCHAIARLEAQVDHWRFAYQRDHFPDVEERVKVVCREELEKLEALYSMYRIETGVDYHTE